MEDIVSGISEGCLESGSALLGGETAEMPGMYESGEYDLAGFAVGAVERDKLIDGKQIEIGDLLLGLPSSGVHSNGFSLVRKILKDHKLNLKDILPGTTKTLGEALLTPTIIYVKPILKLLAELEILGMSHITGGGLPGNVPRMLPEKTLKGFVPVAEIEKSEHHNSWPKLPIFSMLQQVSGLPDEELFPVFNMGIGFVICVAETNEGIAREILTKEGQPVFRIGQIVSGNKRQVCWK